MTDFVMPSLGADMVEGTVLHWLVHPGDRVRRGDIVAEVDTTKAAIEVECFDEGVIGSILVPEGATVPVGTPLATIATETDDRPPSETGSAGAPPPPPVPISAVRATPLIVRMADEAGLDLTRMHGSGPDGRIVRADIDTAIQARSPSAPGGDHSAGAPPAPAKATPTPAVRASGYARRLAAESGADLTQVLGSGPGGARRSADLRPAGAPVPAIAPAHAPVLEAPPPPRDASAVRRAISAAMTRSKQTVPHYYLSSTIDLDATVRWLRETNRRLPVSERILSSALLMCAAARAAKSVPEMNGHWREDTFEPASAVHLGVVVSLRGSIGLPTIPDADTLSPAAMMSALRGVVTRTRASRLRSSDTVPATISVTNLGDLGVDSVFGVIAAPQVAIVGFGAVTDRPCAVDGMLGIRPQVNATLSGDHRASDGWIGARFLHTVADLLRHPEEL